VCVCKLDEDANKVSEKRDKERGRDRDKDTNRMERELEWKRVNDMSETDTKRKILKKQRLRKSKRGQ
jgi:hypothetical protein